MRRKTTRKVAAITHVMDVLSKVAREASRNKKEALLERLSRRSPKTLQRVLSLTYDPNVHFGITVDQQFESYWGPIKDPATVAMCGWSVSAAEAKKFWRAFQAALDALAEGRVSRGTKSQEQMEAFLETVPEPMAFWFARIVNKDLKIGIGASTIEKMFPEMYPVIKPQLCKSYKDEKRKIVLSQGKWSLEPKFDGLRGIIVVDRKGRARAFTRKGKPVWNVDHILKEVEGRGQKDIVLDGEFYGRNWNETLSTLKTQSKKPNTNIKFYVFDYLTGAEWREQYCDETLTDRRYRIAELLKRVKYLVQTTSTKVDSEVKLAQVTAKYLKQGYEGGVLKHADSKYTFSRSGHWLKVKPVFEDDFVIVGVERGTGRNQHRLGALIVKGTTTYLGKRYKIETQVGTGFSDKDRETLWKAWAKGRLKGMHVQVEYQMVAESESKKSARRTTHALRFPAFVRLRPDK